jgi:hypothetical protein
MKKNSVFGTFVKTVLALAVLAGAAAAIAWRFWPDSWLAARVDGPMRAIDAKVRSFVDNAPPPEEEPAAGAPAKKETPSAPRAETSGEPGTAADRPAKTPAGEKEQETKSAEARDTVWIGVDKEHHLQGMKTTAANLAGKVVLVCEFAYDQPQSIAVLPNVQQIWQAFRGKPFVLLGSLRTSEGKEDKKAVRDLTFPVFRDMRHAKARRMRDLPLFYLVSPEGKIVWSGRSDREATEAVVDAVGAAALHGMEKSKTSPGLKSSGLDSMKNKKNASKKAPKGGGLKGPSRVRR